MICTIYIRAVLLSVVLSIAGLCCSLSAQTTPPVTVPYSQLPYFEGFEDADTVAKYWQLNKVARSSMLPRLPELWYPSTAEHYMGNGCLLVSDTTVHGQYSIYGDKFVRVVSYVEFELIAGQYDVSFAWRCLGERTKKNSNAGQTYEEDNDGEGDGLFVGFMSATAQAINSTNNQGTMQPTFLAAHKEMKGDYKSYNGSQYWKVENYTVNVATPGKYRLYFVWNNDGDELDYLTPSACVDNVQLAPATGLCPKPTNFTCVANGLDATLSWEGTAAAYEVRYREYGATNYYGTLPVITPGDPSGKTSITIKNMKTGMFDFFVRAICAEGDTSMWVVAPGEHLFYDYQAEGRCIDFTDLDAAEMLTAKVSAIYTDYSESKTKYRVVPRDSVDFGPGTGKSRITVHNRPGEVDRRTEGRLKTIPDGEVQSVRLGTWGDDMTPIGNADGNGFAQKITYDYTVPATGSAQILLLNYALVLQIPVDGSHDVPDENGVMSNMPHFTLGIYEMVNGEEVLRDATCHSADFNADYRYLDDPNSGWKGVYGDRNNPSLQNLHTVYKEWSPVGFDLSQFMGKQLRIRLATYDCRQTGHFGYAYFTLRCMEAVGTGLMCGNEEQSTLEAPYGFQYEWYRPSSGGTGTPALAGGAEARVFVDKMPELGKYTCKLTNIQTGCVTDYYVDLKPRRPKSAFIAMAVPNTECRNLWEFINLSRVEVDGKPSEEKPEYAEWDFGAEYGGVKYSERDTIEFPQEGDTIEVKLYTTINKKTCEDWYDSTVVIPSVVPAERDGLEVQTCGDEPYRFKDENGKVHLLTEPGDTILKIKNRFGCEYEQKIHLSVYNLDSVAHHDTICEGDTCRFNGQGYYRTGSYKGGRFTSSQGCDSVPWLHLVVRESVVWSPQMPAEICADDEEIVVPYVLTRGADEAKRCRVEFGERAVTAGFRDIDEVEIADSTVLIPMPEAVRPDHYEAQVIFSTDSCGDFPQTMEFTVAYPAWVMEQKWDDVIALKSPQTIVAEMQGGVEADYTFAAYRWCKDGVEMAGETGSYIYVGRDGAILDVSAEYSVLLMRAGENYSVPTCRLTPVAFVPKSDYPTLTPGAQSVVSAGARMEVSVESDEARWYGMDGRLLREERVIDGAVTAPMQAGVYMLQMMTGEMRKIVVKNE